MSGGMFGQDKQFGLSIEDAFTLGDSEGSTSAPFVLLGAAVDLEAVPTELGDAAKTRMKVQRWDDNERKTVGPIFEVTTLASAIADKAEQAVPDDFPCLVELRRVKSRKYGTTALVLQWVGDLADELDILGRVNMQTGEQAAPTSTNGETAQKPAKAAAKA